MKIPFTKMHGTGNDFVVIDARKGTAAAGRLATHEACRNAALFLCDRRFGVGADQVLLLRDSDRADFRMEIFNADGSEVEMCGNGIRCFARYIWDRGLSGKDTLEVETLAGIIRPGKDEDLVRVDMGEPILDGPAIPVNIEGRVMDRPISIDGREFLMTCVSMGNPHAVIFVDDVAGFPVTEVGPKIENHSLFTKRTNVEFVQIVSRDEVSMRVWERGSGETLACGTGACATVVASILKGFTNREVTVRLSGGALRIAWGADNRVIMSGPAVEVFEGSIEI